MPKPDQYIAKFGLANNAYLAGYYLAQIDVDHITIQKYKEYQYPTKMIWKVFDKTADPTNFQKELIEYLAGYETIYTKYKNPYQCIFGTLSFDFSISDQITATSTGSCRRI